MTTGDPSWPCGHTDFSMGCLVKPEKCPQCHPAVEKFVVPVLDNGGSYPSVRDRVNKLFEGYQAIAKKYNAHIAMIHDEIMIQCVDPKDSKAAVAEISALQMEVLLEEYIPRIKAAAGKNQFFLSLYGSEQNFQKGDLKSDSFPMQQIPREKIKDKDEEITYATYARTGRMRTKDKNISYPRELNEPHCEGCGRELWLYRQDVPSIEWRAYHFLADLGSYYYCRREFYHATKANEARAKATEDKHFVREVLGEFVETSPEGRRIFPKSRAVGKSTELGEAYERIRKSPMKIQGTASDILMHPNVLVSMYETCQGMADRPNPLLQTSKDFLKKHPLASEAWSAALRAKVRASEEARKKEESMHWNPYEGWDD